MKKAYELVSAIGRGIIDDRLNRLYGSSASGQRERYINALRRFDGLFGNHGNGKSAAWQATVSLFSAPGRTEICGNHLDHQKGCVTAAAVDLDMIAAAAPNGSNSVNILSEGFSMIHIDLADLNVHPGEAGTSAAIVRGIAAGFSSKGIPVHGFDAYVNGNVPAGSGLSSSAAFEVLIGNIFNWLAMDSSGLVLSAQDIARTGQFAENDYFGKPSGLMDQMACSLGGFTYMDFENDIYESLSGGEEDLLAGLSLCIVSTGGSHEDLTGEYAAVRGEMSSVAGYFGAGYLRRVGREEFFGNIPQLREKYGDRAVLRAAHFFDESDRVEQMKTAVTGRDTAAFLALIRDSGNSSYKLLQNIYPQGSSKEQNTAVALMLTEQFIKKHGGACRIHGGGFAGTIQAFIPEGAACGYREYIENIIGPDCCSILHIRADGGVRVV